MGRHVHRMPFRPPSEEGSAVENTFLRLDQANHCATTLRESACQGAQATCKTTMCCVQVAPESDSRNATKCLWRPRHLPLRALLALAANCGTSDHRHIGLFDIKAAFAHSPIVELHVLIPPSVAWPLVQEPSYGARKASKVWTSTSSKALQVDGCSQSRVLYLPCSPCGDHHLSR